MTCKECIHNTVCKLYLKEEDAERCKHYSHKEEWVRVKRYKHHFKNGRKTIGQIIYEKRKLRKLTQNKLAEKIDCCATTLASWELGKAYPNALFLVSLADAFECTIDELCGRIICEKEH